MCRIFIEANPESYQATTRSVRLHGVVTSVRLENQFWDTLTSIGARDGLTVPHLLEKLYDELHAHRGEVPNFASFLRVCCLRYLALQLSGQIPAGEQPLHALATAPVPAVTHARTSWTRQAPGD